MKYCIIVFCLLVGTETYSQVFPLKNSENNRYLVDQDNKPFPILGRTAWCVISQPVSGYTAFIENTLAHGYNAIEMSVICHWTEGNHSPFNGAGDIPFLKRLDGSDWNGSLKYKDTLAEAPDFNTPNEKYWKYVDTFLSYCERKKVLVLFFPGYVGYPDSDQGWMPELVANGQEKVRKYGEWIAKRYKNQKNLVWMLLGDMGIFNSQRKEAEAALIAGLKSVPEQQSIHYSAESRSGENSVDQPDFGHEMTLNGVYTWDSVGIPTLGQKAYLHKPVMPAFLLEEPYDEEGPDGNKYNPHAVQPVRRFAIWGWLTTTGGYVAGNGHIWQFIDTVWTQHLNTQTAFDMERLNALIRSIEWWNLVPSGMDGMKNLITDGAGSDTATNYVAAAATRDGKMLIVYIPPSHKGDITVDLTVLKNKISAEWFDPSSGQRKKIKGSPFSNKTTHKFVAPGKNHGGYRDWLLVVRGEADCEK